MTNGSFKKRVIITVPVGQDSTMAKQRHRVGGNRKFRAHSLNHKYKAEKATWKCRVYTLSPLPGAPLLQPGQISKSPQTISPTGTKYTNTWACGDILIQTTTAWQYLKKKKGHNIPWILVKWSLYTEKQNPEAKNQGWQGNWKDGPP